MGSLNKVMLIGNLGRDAELRYTPGGDAVATINLATTDAWKGRDGEKKEKTEWHRVVLWGKSAEALAEYLKKGKQIYVEGQLQTRKWQDKEGADRYTTEVRAWRVQLLGRADGSTSRRQPEPDAAPKDEFDTPVERAAGDEPFDDQF